MLNSCWVVCVSVHEDASNVSHCNRHSLSILADYGLWVGQATTYEVDITPIWHSLRPIVILTRGEETDIC